jgi:hypothetical protein
MAYNIIALYFSSSSSHMLLSAVVFILRRRPWIVLRSTLWTRARWAIWRSRARRSWWFMAWIRLRIINFFIVFLVFSFRLYLRCLRLRPILLLIQSINGDRLLLLNLLKLLLLLLLGNLILANSLHKLVRVCHNLWYKVVFIVIFKVIYFFQVFVILFCHIFYISNEVLILEIHPPI